VLVDLGPLRDYYADVNEHDRIAGLLTADQRAWLARMADVLPPGWVVSGMATPLRGGVVCDSMFPGGVRLVVPPAGPSGQARAQ
jgi:hypothetical protein